MKDNRFHLSTADMMVILWLLIGAIITALF